MPIPYRLNPMGKSNRPVYYELTVKPSNGYNDGVTGMGVRIQPRWATGGYCSIDWGDGSKEDAVTSGTKIDHVYTTMDLFIIKIKGDLTRIIFSGRDGKDALNWIDCVENWDVLGDITEGDQMFDSLYKLNHTFKTLPPNITSGYCMFRGCAQADFTFTSLPEGLKRGSVMFQGCSKATLPLTSLPAGLSASEGSMFNGCTNAQLPLTSLPEGLTNGSSMFQGCTNATLPLISLPEGLTSGYSMFCLCGNAELSLTNLPEGLTNGYYMFLKCYKAHLRISKLPDRLTNGHNMFSYCYQAEIDLDELAANAPADGWTALTNITYMFSASPKVTGSRSAFLAKCPANVTGADTAFLGTNTTE